ASELALSQIKRHIDLGRPVFVGVNEPSAVPGTDSRIDYEHQPVSEHFLALYGYETDIYGNFTRLFGQDNAAEAAAEVVFYVKADGSIAKPAERRPVREAYIEREYQLSEVRFHPTLRYTGELLPVNDEGKIMYWPNEGLPVPHR